MTTRSTERYPVRYRRTALIPALLTAAILIFTAPAGFAFATITLYVVTILSLIVAVFAWQAGQWWWGVAPVAVAVVFNPLFPLSLGAGTLAQVVPFAAAALLIASAVFVKVLDDEKRG
jgi:hypothetical protein